MVDETQRQRAFTRPATGRNLATALSGQPANIGYDRAGPDPRSRSAQSFENYMNRGMQPTGRTLAHEFNRQQSGPPANIGFDRMGIGSLQDQAAVDPSDWRVIQQILKGGGNPDDYIQTAAIPRDDWRTWEKILGAGGNPDDYEVTGIKPRTGDDFDITGGPYYPGEDFGGFTQTASNDLMQTNGFINLLNDMYNSAIQDGNQREADTYLREIQSLMGTLPRAARGGLMSLRR